MENINIYDEELLKLRESVDRKHRLERELEMLSSRQARLDIQLDELREIKYKEQTDVDRLEGRTLTRLWYCITGKTDEKLSREKEEALAAAAKYDAAKAESDALSEQIGRFQNELSRLMSCENRYAEKLKAKRNTIRAEYENGASGYDEFIRLDDSVSENARKLRELDEAISAGESARSVAERAVSHLESAEGFASWDVFGGGLIADMAKHEKIDEAQCLIETLQIRLSSFRCELTDIDITADISISIDDTLKFADFFFDGLIADIMVSDRISKALENVRRTKSQVAGMVNSLQNMKSAIEREYERDKARLEEMVLRTGKNNIL